MDSVKSGQTVKLTISKTINREGARKTIERLFMSDKAVAGPLAARSANFITLPKRRGGQIWTKLPNKVHPKLVLGDSATVKITPQFVRDLGSVATFLTIAGA